MKIPITLHSTQAGWVAVFGDSRALQISTAAYATLRGALLDAVDSIEQHANTDDVVFGPYAAPPEPKETGI
jgi:hypothetical protein